MTQFRLTHIGCAWISRTRSGSAQQQMQPVWQSNNAVIHLFNWLSTADSISCNEEAEWRLVYLPGFLYGSERLFLVSRLIGQSNGNWVHLHFKDEIHLTIAVSPVLDSGP